MRDFITNESSLDLRRKDRPGAVGLAPANPALPTAGGLP
jgi:hypothetical protein